MRPIYITMTLLLGGWGAIAQEYPQDYQNERGPNQGEPPEAAGAPGPGRGMARISVLNGDVSVRRGDSGDVTAAAINAPVGSGDALLTGSAARAELQFDAADMVRVAANSEVRMGDLQYRHNQIQIALGLVTFNVIRNTQSQNEIDTPNVAVHPRGRGAFRILVRDDGSSEVTVRMGEADIASAQGTQILKAGQTMMVRGSKDDPEFQILNAIQEDDWDRWNVDRDRELTHSASTRYVNPDVNGVEDLDNNGRWVNDGQYGQVWTPNVAEDWAPYRDGRWMWGDDYGWTWVGAEPWGWAPYHYGRWYHAGFGWAWWPGPLHGPCYWSPALVGFFGFGGGGLGVGFGFGNVGWVPLAPFEVFHPWWGRGYGGYGGYGRSVVVNNFNVYNSYRNARVAGGVSGVAAGSFGRGAGRFTAVGGSEIRNAGMVRGALPMTPDRSSLRMSDRAVNMSNFRQARTTTFFGRGGSSAARVTPFEQQRSAIQQSNGGGFSRGAASTAPSQGAAVHGWNRFGEPIHSSTNPAGSGATSSSAYRGNSGAGSVSGSGWSRNSATPAGGEVRSQAPTQSYGRNSYSGGNSAVRISPPIVRERPAQSYSAPSYSAPRSYAAPSGGNQYGGGRSQTYSAPRSYAAPSGGNQYGGGRSQTYSAPAPRSYGGGGGRSQGSSAPRSAPSGGGGGRSSGNGGGGGGHPSGGGHHR